MRKSSAVQPLVLPHLDNQQVHLNRLCHTIDTAVIAASRFAGACTARLGCQHLRLCVPIHPCPNNYADRSFASVLNFIPWQVNENGRLRRSSAHRAEQTLHRKELGITHRMQKKGPSSLPSEAKSGKLAQIKENFSTLLIENEGSQTGPNDYETSKLHRQSKISSAVGNKYCKHEAKREPTCESNSTRSTLRSQMQTASASCQARASAP